jgi:hypothetical protein
MALISPTRLALPQVTLLAVTSVNVDATIAALEASMTQIAFGAAKLLSDRAPCALPSGLEWVRIAPLTSARAYSEFVLGHLADHVDTSHCLLCQWDGHVIDAGQWRPEFLEYDFIGARWPHFTDGHDIGNGGFSLRSQALLNACRDPVFRSSHPEDLAIGRHNREWLEAQGLRFAPGALADHFSAERTGNPFASFGYHGVWQMPRVLGRERFWEIYRQLDELTSIRHDFRSLFWQLAGGKGGNRRAFEFTCDWIRHSFRNQGKML